MTEAIRVRGWIQESSVVNPTQDIYALQIAPEDPSVFIKLEQDIEELKRFNERPTNRESTTYHHKDKVIDGCCINLESLYQPKLTGELAQAQRDEELLGIFIQALGHLQILKDGNVFLSVELIDSAYPDNFDPID
tara:strand:- start:274 stop:678 length:405 start_codon:yes stop_codon:yes gene_type:complete